MNNVMFYENNSGFASIDISNLIMIIEVPVVYAWRRDIKI
jgi:hypothetical protein